MVEPAFATNTRDWRRRVTEGYGSDAELEYWIAGASRGWTFAEAELLERYSTPGGRVLVVGSGGGRELVALARRTTRAVGIELVPNLLLGYRDRHTGDERQPVALADMACLPFREGAFDLVLMFNQVLGHGPTRSDRIAALSESIRVLKPQGTVLVSFYAGAVEDDSLLLEAWSWWVRIARTGGPTLLSGPVTTRPPRDRQERVKRHVRSWLHGKAYRMGLPTARQIRVTRVGGRQGADILLPPSGRTGEARPHHVPFHVYSLEEFAEDVARGGGKLSALHCNIELNARAIAPNFIRRLDHLYFAALRRRSPPRT